MIIEGRRLHFCNLHDSGYPLTVLAMDTTTGMYAGYCVISVPAEKTGEVKSLCVDAAYRPAPALRG
jgi:hypothetical protein